jgi:hypothetical protein
MKEMPNHTGFAGEGRSSHPPRGVQYGSRREPAKKAPGLCGIAVALLLAPFACAQTGMEGHWEGVIKSDNGEIRISLDLARNAQSQWVASVGVPPQASGLVVTDLAVEDKSVKFTALEMMMTKFDLVLNADGGLRGTYTPRMGNGSSVEFKRSGEAKVALIAPIPAVSRELEGDWEGSLSMGPGQFQILFHFRNQPDKTVKATIDTPASNGFGMPLDSVKQTGRAVEVGIRIAGASFKGTLNAEGTELTGQFMHDTQGTPLTLKKK